jgi:predicted nucleotidyltransferase
VVATASILTAGDATPTLCPVHPKLESTLNQAVKALESELGSNLYSCCLYGSAVRGNAIKGVSDLNLLIVLNESNSAAHQAVARALADLPLIDPFVLAKRGFDRSVRAFASKFASIRRNHRVLSGADPLAEVKLDPQLERFLCEQAVRNLRLRLVYSFVTRKQHKSYDKFVSGSVTAMFVHFSEALRLDGVAIPTDFEARIPVLEREYKIDGQLLRDLLALKHAPRRFSDAEIIQLHERLFPLVDAVLGWIEERWAA